MKTIKILNGPNLNHLGKRKQEVYGTQSMEQILIDIQQTYPEQFFEYQQSNHEGDLIDWLQDVQTEFYEGVVLNAGGLTHTSVSLRDAVEEVVERGVPVVEVHISNIYARESFRQISLLSEVCNMSIIGQGTEGYKQAVKWIKNH